MVLIMMPSLLKLHLTRSEGFRASWVFFASPADRVEDRSRVERRPGGVLSRAALVVLALVYTYMVGNLWHVAVHLALQGLLGYLVLQVAMLDRSGAAFLASCEKRRRQLDRDAGVSRGDGARSARC